MTKSETMKQLAAASNAARLDELGRQIEALRTARIENVEQLALMLEPLAQAMAALTDEARQTLADIEQQSREQGERFKSQVESAVMALTQASALAQEAAEKVEGAGQRAEWRHYLLTVMTGLMSALLVTAFWLWLAPPSVYDRPDTKEVPALLKPEIAPVKQSKDRYRRWAWSGLTCCFVTPPAA